MKLIPKQEYIVLVPMLASYSPTLGRARLAIRPYPRELEETFSCSTRPGTRRWRPMAA